MNELNLKNRVAVILAGGVICSSIAKSLANHGVRSSSDLNFDTANKLALEIKQQYGVDSIAIAANVLKRVFRKILHTIHEQLGELILINGAGGNAASATTKAEFLTTDDLNKLEGLSLV